MYKQTDEGTNKQAPKCPNSQTCQPARPPVRPHARMEEEPRLIISASFRVQMLRVEACWMLV